jgi:hypothetical protein
MQFTGKAPSIGLNTAMRDAKEHQSEGEMVLAALADNPAFHVHTAVDSHWICPYSGTLVACRGDDRSTIQNFLFQRKPWSTRRNGKPRPLFLILEQKWLHHLNTAKDARFTEFNAAGAWKNPFTGAFHTLPRARAAGDRHATAEIARCLAECPAAQSTPLTALAP